MNIIEKLEALHSNLIELVGEIDEVKNLRTIIEQEKSKISEGLKNSQAEAEPVATVYECKECGEWYRDNPVSQCDCFPKNNEFNVFDVFTAPQPTPQDVIDAKKWREWLASIEATDIDQVITSHCCKYGNEKVICHSDPMNCQCLLDSTLEGE